MASGRNDRDGALGFKRHLQREQGFGRNHPLFQGIGMQRKAIYTREDTGVLTKNGRGWNFHDAETQEHLHVLHPYPAKFIPQIPRKAIATWTAKGELVYDPFVGCGTTLLEAS